MAAIETAQILLYARLTVLAADARLNPHYNAVAKHELHPLVLAYKWRRLLTSDVALLGDGDPAVAVAGALPVPRRSQAAYAAVLRVRLGEADLQLHLGEELSARVVHAYGRHLPVVP